MKTKLNFSDLYSSIEYDSTNGVKDGFVTLNINDIPIKFDIKKPGDKTKILNKNLEFHYKSLTNEQIMNAYERLILDVFIGDTMLFARSDFVEEAWKVVDPIIRDIKLNKINLLGYKSGTWGPEESNSLFRNKNTWRYPCKNLINDGESCLL